MVSTMFLRYFMVVMTLLALAASEVAGMSSTAYKDTGELLSLTETGAIPEMPIGDQSLRSKRQASRNTNIFALLFQLIGETRRDLQKTVSSISRQIESSLVDENTISNSTDGEARSSSSDKQPISRQAVTRVLSRNWRGLTRLFNREVELAVDQSNKSAAEARKAFWNSLAPFLEPASTTSRTTTTTSAKTTAP